MRPARVKGEGANPAHTQTMRAYSNQRPRARPADRCGAGLTVNCQLLDGAESASQRRVSWPGETSGTGPSLGERA
jgi:hypothetical protein